MIRHLICGVVVLIAAASAQGQVIYQPVQYQFGDAKKYYYGGTDPNFARFLQWQSSRSMYDRPTGYGLNGGRVDAFGEPATQVARVNSDWYPFEKATVYGYTPADAYNEANAHVPLYFTKRDAVIAALPTIDCSSKIILRPTTQPAAKGTILIIPKRLLDQKPAASDKLLSSAR